MDGTCGGTHIIYQVGTAAWPARPYFPYPQSLLSIFSPHSSDDNGGKPNCTPSVMALPFKTERLLPEPTHLKQQVNNRTVCCRGEVSCR
jgi:hypothetical protein